MANKKEVLQKKVRSISGGTFTDTPWWSRNSTSAKTPEAIKAESRQRMERLDINQEWKRREERRSPRDLPFRPWASENKA